MLHLWESSSFMRCLTWRARQQCSISLERNHSNSFITDWLFTFSNTLHFIFYLSTSLGNKIQPVIPHGVSLKRRRNPLGIALATHHPLYHGCLQWSHRNLVQLLHNFLFEFLLGDCHPTWSLTKISHICLVKHFLCIYPNSSSSSDPYSIYWKEWHSCRNRPNVFNSEEQWNEFSELLHYSLIIPKFFIVLLLSDPSFALPDSCFWLKILWKEAQASLVSCSSHFEYSASSLHLTCYDLWVFLFLFGRALYFLKDTFKTSPATASLGSCSQDHFDGFFFIALVFFSFYFQCDNLPGIQIIKHFWTQHALCRHLAFQISSLFIWLIASSF